jgi:hypothetical protein
MTILDRTITLTFTLEEALSLRIACNETGSNWTTRGLEASANGEDAETCYRISARYSAIWDRIAEAMNAPAPAPAPAPCCEFHRTGGAYTLTCGGDNGHGWRDRYGRPLVETAPACETFAAPRGDNGGLL